MQTLQQETKERDRVTKCVAGLAQDWRVRLACDCPQQSEKTRESIIRWLIGDDLEKFTRLNSCELALAQQAMAYRYRILRQRYLGIVPSQAYRHLTTRLGSLVLLRNKINSFVTLGHDRQQAFLDVLQEVIQELLQRDRYMQQQIAWIAECTNDAKLGTALLLAATEEYCLRPIRNQPLLAYRFFNYLRRTQPGGLTQIPKNNSIRLLSDELLTQDSDNPLSFLDSQALSEYQDTQAIAEQQALRMAVQQEFASYLATRLGSTAVQWLKLYLQGKSQEAIARQLNLSVKEVYRLREKISYHAVRMFGLKHRPELVNSWLETSLQEHNFGLTPQQWQQFWQRLTPQQRQVIKLQKAGKDLEAIAQALNLKNQQLMSEWSKLYLTAQTLRSQG